MKNRTKKILLTIAFIYASLFPESGLIHHEKTLEELEDSGEIHLGI